MIGVKGKLITGLISLLVTGLISLLITGLISLYKIRHLFFRSLHMHLYGMHKREIFLALAGFLSTFVLLLFIGLAGPNVTKLDVIKASDIFKNDNINSSVANRLLSNGPFLVYTPAMSTYSQHLCLYATFYLKNEESSETFNKEFIVALKIEGTDTSGKSGKGVIILDEELSLGGGRTHHLYCSDKRCDPIQVFHLEFLEYQTYGFEVSFKGLESIHEKYAITDIRFTFQSINSSFTTLTIWFRFLFLAGAFAFTVCSGFLKVTVQVWSLSLSDSLSLSLFLIHSLSLSLFLIHSLSLSFFFLSDSLLLPSSLQCWFTHSLHRYSITEWSMEQKWIAILLPLLVLYDSK